MWRPCIFLALALAVASCSTEEATSPFAREDAGADASIEADASSSDASEEEPDPTLGGPCLDDGQCDDGVACTADRCDPVLGRCRHTPDDSLCQDGVYCNGLEVCELRLGCRPGAPVTCSDQDACTIDRCIEETQSCERLARDADGDGDPDVHCGGGDCDDDDPLVSSKSVEICANGRDDDCDGIVDEEDCVVPAHDRCDDALVIDGPGIYSLSLVAASHDYAASCAPTGPSVRDVVAMIELPQGSPRDIDIVATTPSLELALALAESCGAPDGELVCHRATRRSTGDALARIRARSASPGAHPLYVITDRDTDVTLRVRFLEPSSKPDNETCGSARALEPFVQTTVPIIDAERDLASACSAGLGDLVYAFTLSETSDVRLRATSEDGFGEPILSLRDEACALPEDELACASGQPAVLYQRALEAGTYYVGVSATAATELKLVLEVSPPTEPPADEGCEGAPLLPHNVTILVDLADHTDDVRTGCSTGFVDAAYTLDIAESSDVLLVQRFAQGDIGAVQLAKAECASPDDRLACGVSARSPARASIRKLPPGSYRAIAESRLASDATLMAFVRPYSPPTLVAFADRCADAVLVPKGGGFFQGNTANATADYPAGCDYGAGGPNGAPEQMLRLDLDTRSRVVLDMSGSGYPTLLNLRQGPSCPGVEVESSCDVGNSSARSYLDRVLEPGSYWIQIDGFAGASGPWFLDVRIVDP